MFIGLDNDFKRVHIEKAVRKNEYYCPACHAPLDMRKGDVRRHHFAHAKKHVCTDSWSKDREHNMSDWHDNWQNLFPEKNQEIPLKLDSNSHRADVMIGRTVLEFQHSPINAEKFADRNKFYTGLGCKVIWLFDYIKQYNENRFIELNGNFIWKNPSRTFKYYDEVRENGQAELFFQLSDNDIIHITNVSDDGFEKFNAYHLTKTEFLDSLKLESGIYPEPDIFTPELEQEYKAFQDKYSIVLNSQQEKAVQAVDGAVLLLSVPGSGKTTVLIARIGYMVYVKRVMPESILAITYTKKAAVEMKKRFETKFGNEYSERITFSTINSLCYNIIRYYCNKKGTEGFRQLSESEITSYLRKAYYEINDEYPSEAELKQLSTEVTRVKNGSELKEMHSFINNFEEVFYRYNETLIQNKVMDYDDQIIFAVRILNKNNEILQYYKDKFRYISVDETQDTSKMQYELIKKLSGDNVFMVGDEDQSIYSFRGAFPRALINFEKTYLNPYVLRMETNYRSYKEITDKANDFIRKNRNRHPKAMYSSRGKGGNVKYIDYYDEYDEISGLIELLENLKEETAVLYRDSDCAINLIAQLIKNNIPFNLKQNSTTFFTNRYVLDILSFLRLAVNPNDEKSFMNVYHKYHKSRFTKKEALDIIEKAHAENKPLSEVLAYNSKGSIFSQFMVGIRILPPKSAIMYIYKGIAYDNENSIGERCLRALRLLAEDSESINEFTEYVDRLNESIKTYEEKSGELLTLSTIHSSKGLEFKNVIIIDACEGIIPKIPESAIEENESKKDLYQEERRLFYVAMTRARDSLKIVKLKNKKCPFVNELFGLSSRDDCPLKSTNHFINENYGVVINQPLYSYYDNRTSSSPKTDVAKTEVVYSRNILFRNHENSTKNDEVKEVHLVDQYTEGYEQVKDKFVQQETQIRDGFGMRWVKCVICGKIDTSNKFLSFGGPGSVNSGKCRECCKQNR